MEKVQDLLQQIPDWLTPIGFLMSIILMIVAAILMMTGQEGASKAKKWMTYIVIGFCVMFLAVSIMTTIRGTVE